MLFRFSVFILAACSVLVAGCRASSAADTTSRGAAAKSTVALNQLQSGRSQDPDSAVVSPEDGSVTNDKLEDLIDAHAHYAAGVIHEMNLEPQSALDEYYKAAALDPTNVALVLDVSQQFLQARQADKALSLLKEATTNSTASGELFAELGFVYSKLGKTNEAFNADRAAIQKDPRSIGGYQSLFIDYLQNGQTKQMWPLLEEASKVNGTDAEFLIDLAGLYFRFSVQVPAQKKQADERALELLQRAAKTKTSDVRLQMHLADGFNLLGKTEEAARLYENISRELPKDSPEDDAVRAKLADIYLHSHDLKHASEQLQGILRDNPTDPQTYYLLGGIAYDETNYTRAVDYFEEAIAINPDLESAYYDMATAQLESGRIADASATLDKARRKFPQNFMAEYLSGVACNEQKDYTNALQHFTTAEVVAETSSPGKLTDNFYFQMGATCERLGDYLRAEKCFEKSLSLAPDSSETLNYLGYMWADHGMKLDQARELIAKAVKAEPKNAAYLDSMAWVLYKLHEPKPALDYALKAIQFSEEEDATLYDHIGDIYAALGQKDKARQSWTKSLSLEKSDAVRKKLESGTK